MIDMPIRRRRFLPTLSVTRREKMFPNIWISPIREDQERADYLLSPPSFMRISMLKDEM